MNKRRLALFGLVSVALIAFLVIRVLSTVEDATDREFRIVIPEGTSAKIYAGENPDIVPQELLFTLGEKDILVIENDDVSGHDIGGFWVGAGETLRKEFHSEAVYQGACTIHPSSQIQIIVSKP